MASASLSLCLTMLACSQRRALLEVQAREQAEAALCAAEPRRASCTSEGIRNGEEAAASLTCHDQMQLELTQAHTALVEERARGVDLATQLEEARMALFDEQLRGMSQESLGPGSSPARPAVPQTEGPRDCIAGSSWVHRLAVEKRRHCTAQKEPNPDPQCLLQPLCIVFCSLSTSIYHPNVTLIEGDVLPNTRWLCCRRK